MYVPCTAWRERAFGAVSKTVAGISSLFSGWSIAKLHRYEPQLQNFVYKCGNNLSIDWGDVSEVRRAINKSYIESSDIVTN